MDRGALWAIAYRVEKSWTQLKRLNTHIHTSLYSIFRMIVTLGIFNFYTILKVTFIYSHGYILRVLQHIL